MNTQTEKVQAAKKRAAQDQQIAELATHIFQMIKQIEDDPEISAIMAGAGYDEDGRQLAQYCQTPAA